MELTISLGAGGNENEPQRSLHVGKKGLSGCVVEHHPHLVCERRTGRVECWVQEGPGEIV